MAKRRRMSLTTSLPPSSCLRSLATGAGAADEPAMGTAGGSTNGSDELAHVAAAIAAAVAAQLAPSSGAALAPVGAVVCRYGAKCRWGRRCRYLH